MIMNPIRSLRGDKTQLEFARQTKMGFSTLRLLEHGGPKTISEESANRLAAYSQGKKTAAAIQQEYELWRQVAA